MPLPGDGHHLPVSEAEAWSSVEQMPPGPPHRWLGGGRRIRAVKYGPQRGEAHLGSLVSLPLSPEPEHCLYRDACCSCGAHAPSGVLCSLY